MNYSNDYLADCDAVNPCVCVAVTSCGKLTVPKRGVDGPAQPHTRSHPPPALPLGASAGCAIDHSVAFRDVTDPTRLDPARPRPPRSLPVSSSPGWCRGGGHDARLRGRGDRLAASGGRWGTSGIVVARLAGARCRWHLSRKGTGTRRGRLVCLRSGRGGR